MEKYFDNEISENENKALNEIINSNSSMMREFEEQKRIKEVFNKMKLKNPSSELWDGYWENTYNKLERGFGWLAIFIGSLILIGYASMRIIPRQL